MKQYEKEWLLLRKTVLSDANEIIAIQGSLSLFAPPRLHKRIIKALRKEKYEDNDFRFHTKIRKGQEFRIQNYTDPASPYILILKLEIKKLL